MPEFDAIVIGSGMSGGWVAKELAERGLTTLVLERGRNIDPATNYADMIPPWDATYLNMIPEDERKRDYPIQATNYAVFEKTKHFWVKDSEHPYEVPADRPYNWYRGYHLGGRSIMWGRQSYRWGAQDFESNKNDGHGVDWPIRYADLAPWYDHVERFAGISGTTEGLAQLPDSQFLPAFDMNCAEIAAKKRIEAAFPTRRMIIGRVAHLTEPTEAQLALGRGQCQVRNHCHTGCSFGAYFSSISATLPAARATGRTTIVTDAIVHSLDYDAKTARVSGVRVIDQNSKQARTYTGKIVFLCASTIPTAMILLESRSAAFPNGLANSSDQVGRNLMDHVNGVNISGIVPGFTDRYYKGRRPNGIYIPRYANITETAESYLRGFGFQGGASRGGWQSDAVGVGPEFKKANRTPGPWVFGLYAFGEQLPDPANRVTPSTTKRDRWGFPVARIDVRHSDNDRKLMVAALRDGRAMLEAAGCTDITGGDEVMLKLDPPGSAIHEMGTARMGRDPRTSVLNGWGQAHDVPNLFIGDGAVMTSSACQNPSLTYMALAARAAAHAAELVKSNVL